MKIMVVDDDPFIVELLKDSLSTEGWTIITASNGEDALGLAKNDRPDLVILDVILPGISGIEVCRQLVIGLAVPVIMLSAMTDIDDKVACLNTGADDYLTKPFNIAELIARVKAVLRRNQSDEIESISTYFNEDLAVDFRHKRLVYRNKEMEMTVIECKLMRELVSNENKTLSYSYLLGKIWGPEYKLEREYLHTYIARLRAKLESISGNKEYIGSIRNVGYFFNPVSTPDTDKN